MFLDKTSLDSHLLGPKILFEPKIFQGPKFVDQQFYWTQKTLRTKKIFGCNIFQTQKLFFISKIYLAQKFLDPKVFVDPKFLRTLLVIGGGEIRSFGQQFLFPFLSGLLIRILIFSKSLSFRELKKNAMKYRFCPY